MGLVNPRVSVDEQTQLWLTGLVSILCKSIDRLAGVVEKKTVDAELHIK